MFDPDHHDATAAQSDAIQRGPPALYHGRELLPGVSWKSLPPKAYAPSVNV